MSDFDLPKFIFDWFFVLLTDAGIFDDAIMAGWDNNHLGGREQKDLLVVLSGKRLRAYFNPYEKVRRKKIR